MYCSAVYTSVHMQWTLFRFVTHGIVLLFTPQYTYSGPSSDLLHMYCSAVYISLHIQWTQFRLVTYVLFCCLHPQYTYSGPSSDLLHMYCSAVYTSVHMHWTLFRFVTHVLFCCLHLSTHAVDPVQICYTWYCSAVYISVHMQWTLFRFVTHGIVLLFTPQYTYSGPSSDLLTMYCSAVYISVHIQWTQFRLVTHVLFCCLHLSTHTVDPVQISYICIVLLFTPQSTCSGPCSDLLHMVLFCCLHLSTHTVDPVQISYICIVLLFTPQSTCSGPSSDLLHMYCSAVYTSVHMQWTQFRFVTHVLFCCLHLSTHTVDPVQICYTCIVLLFTSQYTYSGPSTDLLHMYCSAVYPSVHIQWTQFRFVTHVLFCCLHLSTHTVDLVQICYTCIVLLFAHKCTYSGPSSDLLPMYCSAVYTSVHIQWTQFRFVTHVLFCCLPLSTHTVDPVQICYTCIVLLFTPHCTYSGPSSDLLHMYCSAVYTSVHIQWTQFRLVTYVLFCCLHLSPHAVDPVQICYTCIVLLFTPWCTYSGPSSDLLHMYCSAVYPSVHIQWTQYRFVTHVLFCCLHLSTHTVDPVQICYTCIVLLFTSQYTYSGPSSDLLHMYCSAVYISVHIQWTQFRFVTHVLFYFLHISAHTVDPVQIGYTCIVWLFTPQYTYSGPSSDLLHMYCSAVYISVHIQWTQFRFVTHVLFCCLHLSTHTVDPVQICYTCIVLLFTPQYTYSGPSSDLLHMYCSAVYPSVHIQWTQFRFVTHGIVLLFTPQYTYSGPSSDLLHMYCSAVYISVHIQWTQFRFVTHVLFYFLHISAHTVDPVQICYTCIVLLFTPQYTYSGPSSDLLHMYCSAVYISVHIQWTQFRFVTHVLFCCLPLSTHTVDPVQICYTCIVLLFAHKYTYSGPSSD